MHIKSLRLAVMAALGVSLAAPATAGVTLISDGEKYVKVGGRIQMQYHYVDPDDGSSTDELFFRRLRPYIEGSVHKDWKGKFQFDYGKSENDNEVAIKDAYLQYKGIENMKVTVGNANFPFSRELLTSSKYQQLVERTFVGDHNYGTPDRQLGIHLTGNTGGKHLTWGASFVSAGIDPDNKKLDFDTLVNKDDDFNEGWMFGGRVDYHPFGLLKFSQSDFSGETRATIGVAAFRWTNDDDVEPNKDFATDPDEGNDPAKKADVDEVTGFEVSGAFRGAGFSVDAEYNYFDSETVVNGVTGGIYDDGETDLKNWSVEGGYMVMPSQLELVAGYQYQDADGYDEEWTRTSLGANWYIKKQDIKIQATYRMNDSKDGKDGNDVDEVFLQTQYVF